ncbi:MAG: terminase small subunit, partial [Cyanobacteria bacterium P01_A01_bin.17]
VELATKLAIAMYGHDSEAALFREEGAVIDGVSKKGTPVKRPNPRQSVVRDYVAEIEKLRKMIGINLRAKQGEKRDILKRRKIAKDIESKLPEDDDLFFKPSVN